MASSALPSPSPATATPLIGMGFDSLPPLSICPTIFGFLKSVDLGDIPQYSVGNWFCMNPMWLD